MNGPTKADKIRRMARDQPGATAAEIAEEIGTAESYVYEIRGKMSEESDSEGDDIDPGDDPLGDLGDDPADEPDGGSGIDPDGPLGDLIISDEWEEYECAECEAEVEYLQDTCENCEHDLAWWADA